MGTPLMNSTKHFNLMCPNNLVGLKINQISLNHSKRNSHHHRAQNSSRRNKAFNNLRQKILRSEYSKYVL